jgi:hypothetical protein
MAKGFLVVDEKDWSELAAERRDWLIFNTLKSMDDRLKSLESWNKPLSVIGGVLGGFLAALGLRMI